MSDLYWDPFDPALLSDVEALRDRTSGQLRRLGRLGHGTDQPDVAHAVDLDGTARIASRDEITTTGRIRSAMVSTPASSERPMRIQSTKIFPFRWRFDEVAPHWDRLILRAYRADAGRCPKRSVPTVVASPSRNPPGAW